jgi:iron complex outermembrane receptor protein
MKKITQFLLVTLFIATSTMYGQTVTGTVLDSSNDPLPGADVILAGTTKGASTDFNGNFSLDVNEGTGTVKVSFIGYANKNIEFTVAEGATISLGNIQLEVSQEALDEIVIVGSGLVDLANSRRTPIAVSTIPVTEIRDKIGTGDITTTLVNTPSIYVAGQSGYGDSRISVRGFDQTNTAFLLNGQPINGMEDGKMYWSNWSGLSDIASAVQIQRGLGSSKLAISSVGGTVNFVMNSTAKKEGGMFNVGVANDGYMKTTIGYDTGVNEKGWGASVMLSHWQGNGYFEGNFGKGQTYFISFGYKANEKHNFNFLITGAPQYHDNAFSEDISTYLKYGRKYNGQWGTYNGEYMTQRRNFYHKPVANLNWDYKVNETTNLSTVLYGSWGRGGGTGGRGRTLRTGGDDGRKQIDFDAIYDFNLNTPTGSGGNYAAEGGYVTRASMNLHSWFGAVSNLKKQLSDNLTFNAGVDLRTYYGKHFRVVENFHGLNSWQENIRLRDQNDNHQTFGSFGTYKNVITTRDMSANPWTATFADFEDNEKIAYNNEERISYAGLFTQLEYANDKMSAFFQGALSNQWNQRFDLYQYADQSLIDGTSSQGTGALPSNITAGTDSEKVSEFGFNVKGGASYTIDDENQVYGNAGYYSRQPYQDNIWSAFNNLRNEFSENEKILGLELGYAFTGEFVTANLDLYRTSWKDRVTSSSRIVDGLLQNTLGFGVEQLHQGIELSIKAKATPQLKLNGFISIGDWEYKGSAVTRVQDEDQNQISEDLVDVDGGKVGDAAQFTAGLGAKYTIVENLSADMDFRFYDNLYSNVGAVKENLKLPSYGIADMGVSFKLPLEDGKSISLRANVNNVFNNIYIAELRTAIEANPGDVTYNGLNVDNNGYFGRGRTWNFGLRYKF